MKTLAAAAVAAMLVTAACTSSQSDEAASEAEPAQTEAPSSAAPSSTIVSATTTRTPLTASFRGVTEDAIKIGVHYVDLEAVYDIVGLDHGDYRASYQVVIDAINDAGGINGRTVEPVFEAVDPIGVDPATVACIRLTEDEQVFAVIGAFLNETALCYAEVHDTAVVGGTIDAEQFARVSAPWFTNNASADRLNTDIINAFIDGGELEGATVGVVGVADDRGLIDDVVLPTLEAGGVEVVEVALVENPGGLEIETDAQVAVIAEKLQSSGIDTVVAVDLGVVALLQGLEDVTYRPRVLATSLGNTRVFIRDEAGRDLSLLEGAVAGNQAEQLIWWDDPAVQDCIDLIEAATPDLEIYDPNVRPADAPENIVSIFNACQVVALFEAITTAAGPDLSNESFLAAGEGLGTITMPGLGEMRFGPGKHDGAESIYLYRWDDEAQDLVSDGVAL